MPRYRRKNAVKILFTVYRQNLTVMLRYRRKNTVKIWFTVYRQKLTVENGKTVYRQKVTVMWRYRPVQVRQKYRYLTPPWKFQGLVSLENGVDIRLSA